MDADHELIHRCLDGDPLAQEELYRLYSGRMYGICLRYAGNALEAQDILHEGFVRVFLQLKSFRFQGPLEGWLRRIFINTAINLAKRELRFSIREDLESIPHMDSNDMDGLSRVSRKEILRLIQELPAGYRTVFNLYVVEGYTHKEIAAMLKISVNTSKSQLFAARESLRKKITKERDVNGRE